ITRTSRARIFPLTLTNEAEEAKLRGGKGRLKQPSPVETYSCRLITDISIYLWLLLKPRNSFTQVNNRRFRVVLYGYLSLRISTRKSLSDLPVRRSIPFGHNGFHDFLGQVRLFHQGFARRLLALADQFAIEL